MENTKKQTALEQFIAELDQILDIYPSEWDKINKAAARALKMEVDQLNASKVEGLLEGHDKGYSEGYDNGFANAQMHIITN